MYVQPRININFAEKFKRLCFVKGVSVTQACSEMNMRPSAVSNWESRNSSPAAISIIKICHYFSITPNDFLDFSAPQSYSINDDYILKMYNLLNETGKERFDTYLDELVKIYKKD